MTIETTKTTTIPAPPSAVWAVLADFGAIADWADDVDHSTWLTPPHPGDPVVGDARRVQVGRATLVETVVAVEHQGTLSYTIAGLPPLVPTVTNTWELQHDGAGTTVSLTTRIADPPRPPQRLVLKAVAARLGRASAGLLAGLAAGVATRTSNPHGADR